jgi:hypothetical protein
MDTTSPPNTDLNGLIDHLKWLYFAQSQPVARLHYRLAELAGTGRLDSNANLELQHELVEMSQAIWSGTHSFLERHEYVPEDEVGIYCDGTEIIHKFPATDAEERAWPFHHLLRNGDGAVNDYPRRTRFWLRNPADRTSECPDPKDLPFIGSEVK